MTITFELTRFEIFFCGTNPARPLAGLVEGIFTVEGEVVICPWHIALEELTRRFPHAHFEFEWVGRMCTFIPSGVRTLVIDPECSLFATEVIE